MLIKPSIFLHFMAKALLEDIVIRWKDVRELNPPQALVTYCRRELSLKPEDRITDEHLKKIRECNSYDPDYYSDWFLYHAAADLPNLTADQRFELASRITSDASKCIIAREVKSLSFTHIYQLVSSLPDEYIFAVACYTPYANTDWRFQLVSNIKSDEYKVRAARELTNITLDQRAEIAISIASDEIKLQSLIDFPPKNYVPHFDSDQKFRIASSMKDDQYIFGAACNSTGIDVGKRWELLLKVTSDKYKYESARHMPGITPDRIVQLADTIEDPKYRLLSSKIPGLSWKQRRLLKHRRK